MKKKLKTILAILVISILLTAIGFFYLSLNPFYLPKSVKEKISSIVKTKYGLDLGVNDFVVDLPTNRVTIASISVSVADKAPFVSIGAATFQLASSTDIIGMISNKAIVNKILISDLKYDMMAPQLQEASGAFQLPAILANEVFLDGAEINTLYGNFDLSSNTAHLKKTGSKAFVEVMIPNGPFGITIFLNSAVDLDSNIASISLLLNHENLADCLPVSLFTSERNINMDNGSFDLNLNYVGNIVDRVNNPLESLAILLNSEVYGYVNLKNANFTWNGITFVGDINAERLVDSVWKYRATGKIAEGSIKIEGEWLGRDGSMTDFTANFEAKNIKLKKTSLMALGLPEFDYNTGSLGISGEIRGEGGNFSGKGNFIAKKWKFVNEEVKEVKIDWELLKDLSVKTKSILDTGFGKMNLSSTLWLSGENKLKAILKGKFKDVDLKEIALKYDFPLEGKYSGPFAVELDLANPANAKYTFKPLIEKATFSSFSAKYLEGTITGFGTDWKISNPRAVLHNGGEIVIDGYIASTTLDVKLKAKDVDLINFGLPNNMASGCAQLEATAKGSLFMPEVSGSLWGKNITLMDLPLNSFKGEIDIKDAILTLSPVVVKPVDGSTLDGYFSINLRDSKILNAGINFQQLCLELLRPYLPVKMSSNDMDGILNGYINYARTDKDNRWKIYIDGRDFLLAGQDIDSVYVELDGLGRQAELKSLFIRAFGGKMNLTGNFVDSGKFAGSIEGENIKFDRMEFLKPFLPNFAGNLDFQGDIDWNGNNRKGNFTVFANNLKVDSRDLGNYGGEILVDDEKLEIINGEFDKLGIKLGGDIMWGARRPYQLKLDLKNVDFGFIPQAHGLKAFDNGYILVNGSCLVQGDLASITPDLIDMKLDDFKVQKDGEVIVSNKPMRVLYQNGAAELRSLELKYRLGILSVEGLISPDKNVAVMIDGDNFSAKALASLFGVTGLDFDGDVFLDARIFGSINDIKYSSKAEIKNLKIEGKEIPIVQAKLNGDSNLLELEETFVKLKNNTFNMKGKVELKDFVPQKLNIKLFSPKGPLKDFSDYFPEFIKSANGTVEAKLDIVGNPSSPEIIGDLHLDAKSLQLTSMKKPFTNVVFDMTTDDMITTVNILKAQMGKGNIQGYGTVDFKNASGSLDVHLKAEKLDLPFLSLDVFNASASLDVTGDIYNPDVKGYIYIPRGRLGLSSNLLPDPDSKKPMLDSLKYRFEVEIPRNFWVKNTFLNAELKGKCIISGDLENFNIDGGISTIQGKIFFKQRQFKIQNGEIKFGGVDNSIDPYIFVKSEGQVGSTKIFLTLQGNVSNFKPQVYSTPPMSEGDIISLLALGRDLNSAMNSDSKELFENEVLEGLKNSYLSSLIGDSISTALNLDELYLLSSFNKDTGRSQSYVRIGKYLSERVFMAYEGRMSDEQDESYIFEYRLPKGLVFSVEFEEPKKNQIYGFRYDWQF